MMIKEGAAHHPHSLRNPRPIADWIVEHVQPASDNRPGFVEQDVHEILLLQFREYVHRTSKKNGRMSPVADRRSRSATTDTTRRPEARGASPAWRSSCRRRRPRESPGCSERTASAGIRGVVDLALLAKGFHIVAAPVVAQSGPVRRAVGRRLQAPHRQRLFPEARDGRRRHGGRRSLCLGHRRIRTRFPASTARIPHCAASCRKRPRSINLAPLARAGVPLIHVCGSLDPWLENQTRVVEKRYKELGGPDHA